MDANLLLEVKAEIVSLCEAWSDLVLDSNDVTRAARRRAFEKSIEYAAERIVRLCAPAVGS